MSGYTTKNVLKELTAQSVAANASAQLVSADQIHVFAEDSLHFRVDVAISAIVVATGISLILQHSYNGSDWDNAKTVALTTTGRKALTMLVEVAADQAILPLRPLCRLVVTTGAGDSVTISGVYITRRS